MSDEKTKNASDKFDAEEKFTRIQLVKSKRFEDRRDILSALLDNDTEYTIAQAEDVINKYLKGRVL